LEELIGTKLKEIKEQEKTTELTAQYDLEFDEILAKPDFEEIKSFFTELIEEYSKETLKSRVSPLKLYKRAQKLAQKEPTADDIDIEKLAEEKANKILAQREAAKNNSEAGGAGKDKAEGKLPSGTEDYFKTVM